jgi:DNA-directed RNA polymerase subunit H (RpoH/RPB5)
MIETVKEMMVQRGFREYKARDGYIIGKNDSENYIYIRIFDGKLELNVVREFLSKFTIDSKGNISKGGKNVVQMVIICKSFQNSHIKEFREVSKHIQLIRCDFFNINITKKIPLHQKVDGTIIRNTRELPILKETDPPCKFYNFVKGDVIRVKRSDGEICYRLVR